MDRQTLCKLIDERQGELFSLLSEFVQINTENFGDHGREAALARHLAKIGEKMELAVDLYSPADMPEVMNSTDFWPGRHLEERYNVTLTYPGKRDENGLLLMGHTDTVMIGNPAAWEREPLSGAVENGRVYGRGACDDKYALAVVLFLFRLFADCGLRPEKNIDLCAYCDEECGGSHGAMAACMRKKYDQIINMDGKDKQIYGCASGGGEIDIFFHLEGTQDSAEAAARLLPLVFDKVKEFGDRRREEIMADPAYHGKVPGGILRVLEAAWVHAGADLGRGHVRFVYYTNRNEEEIERELSALDSAIGAALAPYGAVCDRHKRATRHFHYERGIVTEKGVTALQQAAREAVGAEIPVVGPCLSDLSVILKYGGPSAFGFGAGRDFDVPGGAHQRDEFIECADLLDYAKTLGVYILNTLL